MVNGFHYRSVGEGTVYKVWAELREAIRNGNYPGAFHDGKLLALV